MRSYLCFLPWITTGGFAHHLFDVYATNCKEIQRHPNFWLSWFRQISRVRRLDEHLHCHSRKLLYFREPHTSLGSQLYNLRWLNILFFNNERIWLLFTTQSCHFLEIVEGPFLFLLFFLLLWNTGRNYQNKCSLKMGNKQK